MIRKEDGKYVLYSHDGKKQLGSFDSEAAAQAREREIQFFKHQGEGASQAELEPSDEAEHGQGEMGGKPPSAASMRAEMAAMMAKGLSHDDAMAAMAKKHKMSLTDMKAMLAGDGSGDASKKEAIAGQAGEPAAMPRRKTSVLLEQVTVEAANRAEGVLDVTLIRPGWSLNGRYYPREALAAALPKLEGLRAFADHPLKGDRPERSIMDQVGVYRNVSAADDGSLKGQLKLVGAADRKEHVMAWAEESIASGQPLMGLSINGIGRTEKGEAEGREGPIVAELIDFDSVDIVTRPAAGGRFEALAASNGDELMQRLLAALDFDEWREARPEFVARLRREVQTVRRDEQLAEAATQLAEVQTALADAQAAVTAAQEAAVTQAQALDAVQAQVALYERGARAAHAVEAARIPYAYRGQVLGQLLTAVADETHWPAFLAAQSALLAAHTATAPILVQGGGPVAPSQPAQRVVYDLPPVEDGENFLEWKARRDEAARLRHTVNGAA